MGQGVNDDCEELLATGKRVLDSGRQGLVLNLRSVRYPSEELMGVISYLISYAHKRNARLAVCEVTWPEHLRFGLFTMFATEEEALRFCRDR